MKELELHFVGDINVPKFTRQLGVFPFRAFLNIGMLLTESEKAKQLRNRILDIVIFLERAVKGLKNVKRAGNLRELGIFCIFAI